MKSGLARDWKFFYCFILINNFYLISCLDIFRYWLSSWKNLQADSKMTWWGVQNFVWWGSGLNGRVAFIYFCIFSGVWQLMDWLYSKSVQSLGPTAFVVQNKELTQNNFRLICDKKFPQNIKKLSTMDFNKHKTYWWNHLLFIWRHPTAQFYLSSKMLK